MVIGTSALAKYEIDGAFGMYSGIFNNPFIQFHHTQMDGAHAARFLNLLQKEIEEL